MREVAEGTSAVLDGSMKLKHILDKHSMERYMLMESIYDDPNNCSPSHRDGDIRIHIMREFFMDIPIALGLQQRSPFRRSINFKLMQLREAGLIAKWVSDGINSVSTTMPFATYTSSPEPLTMLEMKGIVIVLGVLLFVALVIFIAEHFFPQEKDVCTIF